jgi:hypothetical protein
VRIGTRWSTFTDKDGSFTLDVPVRGTLDVWVSAPFDARARTLAADAMKHGESIVIPPSTFKLDTEGAPIAPLDVLLAPSRITGPD